MTVTRAMMIAMIVFLFGVVVDIIVSFFLFGNMRHRRVRRGLLLVAAGALDGKR